MATKLMVAVSLILMCCGGFFKVNPSPIIGTIPAQAEKPEAGSENKDSYLSATIDIRNYDKLRRETRLGRTKLDYLYIYAEYNHPEFGSTQVPLFLLDIPKGELFESSGQLLINKIPLTPDSRETQHIILNTKAIEKTKFDYVYKVLGAVKSLSANFKTFTSEPVTQAIALAESTARLINELTTGAHSDRVKVPVPTHIEGEGKLLAYLLEYESEYDMANGKAKTPISYPQRLYTFCEDAGEYARLCARDNGGDMVGDGGSNFDAGMYRVDPQLEISNTYILIDYRKSDYVYEKNLLPRKFDKTCKRLTHEIINKASKTISDSELRFTTDQLTQEVTLIERAQAYLNIKSAMINHHYSDAVDAYYDYQVSKQKQSDPDDSFYSRRYMIRHSSLNSCADDVFNSVPFGNEVYRMLKEAVESSKSVDTTCINSDPCRRNMNAALKIIDMVDIMAKKQWTSFSANTKLYRMVSSSRDNIEYLLYERYYSPLIEVVSNALKSKQPDLQDSNTKDSVDTLNKYLLNTDERSSCLKCNEQSKLILERYYSSSLKDYAKLFEIQEKAYNFFDRLDQSKSYFKTLTDSSDSKNIEKIQVANYRMQQLDNFRNDIMQIFEKLTPQKGKLPDDASSTIRVLTEKVNSAESLAKQYQLIIPTIQR